MNDRAIGLLEQYDVEVLRTRKGRGAILCETSRGCLIFKEYTGNEERIIIQNKLLTHLQGQNEIRTEMIIPTKEGSLFVKDNDGVMYILKTYIEGRECNINDRNECAESVKLLARLHACMEIDTALFWTEAAEQAGEINPAGKSEQAGETNQAGESEQAGETNPTGKSPQASESNLASGIIVPVSQGMEYEKRNRELKRVRKYLKQRSQKTWFEISLQQVFDGFLEQALRVTEEWASYEAVRDKKETSGAFGQKITYCHGDYQYHNILQTEQGWFVVNFEKCVPDDQIRDLYLLMRKLLEKSNWSVALGRELLSAYEQVRPISAVSRIDLYYRLAYPEKFWKIANFYYNSGKAWIPERNLEKLKKLVEQEKEKQEFLNAVFQL